MRQWNERGRAIDELALDRDKKIHDEGIYLLLSKNDHVMSHVLVRERLTPVLPVEKRDAIRDAFIKGFKNGEDFDGGLIKGAQAIETALAGVAARHAVVAHDGGGARAEHPVGGRRMPARGHSTLGTFLMIILGIFGVLLVLRLIGGLFNRSAGQGYGAAGMGMPRPGMGGGPGYYGGPGYGGRGGGFFSGMLGGLGGALAGNWLYDQFSGGRHGNYGSADAGQAPDSTSVPDQGGDAIVGADDDPGGGLMGDTGRDTGGGDVGGGDWGGGGGLGWWRLRRLVSRRRFGTIAWISDSSCVVRSSGRLVGELAGSMRCRGVLVSCPTNVRYLTGFTGDSSLLLVSSERAVIISDGRFTTQLEQECPGLEVRIRSPGEELNPAVAAVVELMGLKQVGFEATYCSVADQEALAATVRAVEFVGLSGQVEALRQIKDETEIAAIRESVRVAERAFLMLRAGLRRARPKRMLPMLWRAICGAAEQPQPVSRRSSRWD